MPRPAGSGKGSADRVTIRFDRDASVFYRRKANEAGISLAEYCRQLLVRGVVNDNVQRLEQRISALSDVLGSRALPDVSALSAQSAAATSSTVGAVPAQLDVLTAIFLCREILSATMHDRDPQGLYQAQERARVSAEKVSGARRG